MSPNLDIPLLKFSTNQKGSLGIYCKQMRERGGVNERELACGEEKQIEKTLKKKGEQDC